MTAQQENKEESMVAVAKLKMLKGSPRKLSLLVQMIRQNSVAEAFQKLTFSRKKMARDVNMLLRSAVANAENNHGMDIDNLYVHEVLVGRGLHLKRLRCRAKGRGATIKKMFSKLTIKLKNREE